MVATVIKAERAIFLEQDTDLARFIHQLQAEQAVALFLTPDDLGLVLSGIDNNFYDPDGVAAHLVEHLKAGELRLYRSHSRELSNRLLPRLQNVHGRPMQELLWIAGFHGYKEERCCLDAGCRRDDVIRLRHWPNFTRLPATANSFRLASLFNSRPTSVVLASKILNVPEQEVMQFYNAACYSGLVVRINRQAEPVQTRPHRQQGLISSLFRHLIRNRFGERPNTRAASTKAASTACCGPSSNSKSCC